RHALWAGVYLDCDELAASGLTDSVRKVLQTPVGFGGDYMSSDLVIPAGHPFRLVQLDLIRQRYEKTQAQLLRQQPQPHPPEEILQDWFEAWFEPHQAHKTRRGASTPIYRSAAGPETWDQVGLDDKKHLKNLEMLLVDRAHSWAAEPAPVTSPD